MNLFVINTKQKIRFIAKVFIGIMAIETLAPISALALTSGPSQPEVQSFEPIGTTQMVDPFTGDFVYNIALMDVGGYPLNLAYHSGITNDQEASWVGLGWNINPGSMVRNLRGLPDDFNGDEIKVVKSAKPMREWGITKSLGDLDAEVFGTNTKAYKEYLNSFIGKKNPYISVTLNNYRGVGYFFGIKPQNKLKLGYGHVEIKGSGGIGNQSGMNFNSSFTFIDLIDKTEHDSKRYTLGVGKSRQGIYFTSSAEKRTYDRETGMSKGQSGSGVIPATYSTYYPRVDVNYVSTNVSTQIKFGAEIKGLTTYGGPWEFNYTSQSIDKPERTIPAIGYSYIQNATIYDCISDFNRYNDEAYNKHTKFLNITQHTYDPLLATGQGISGVFRPNKSNVGKTQNNQNYVEGSFKLDVSGLDLGASTDWKVGMELDGVHTYSKKQTWSNEAIDMLSFKTNESQLSPLTEPTYYKKIGEHTAIQETFYDALQWDQAIDLRIDNLKGNWNGSEAISRTEREKRSTLLSVLTTEKADAVGLNKTISDHVFEVNVTNNPLTNNYVPIDDTDPVYRMTSLYNTSGSNASINYHHSEINVTQSDGSRYVYGLPMINQKHIETTFAIGGNGNNAPTTNNLTALVGYSTATDKDDTDYEENEKGIDNYVERKEIPGYAHSFLLTAVLSADYVDVTGDGPSEDDLGNYTKFNYGKVVEDYKWRIPMSNQSNKANHQRGLNSTTMDDRASYIYGEKDIWNVHSIETKTHIAYFYLSDRLDGLGAQGEHGEIDNSNAKMLKKLDKIVLFAKEDLARNSSAKPIKTVHFEYSYDLCPNVVNNHHYQMDQPQYTWGPGDNPVDRDANEIHHPLYNYNQSNYDRAVNSKRGKLTLHKVYFTYGDNTRGEHSPYIFEYLGVNPDYGYTNTDRWGNYKSNVDYLSKSNTEFPYVNQNKAEADLNATAWHLTDINLPSGGHLTIDFESDDYAYVQNKRAMQMVPVEGLGYINENNEVQLNQTNGDELYKGFNPYDVVFFKMEQGTSIEDYIPDQLSESDPGLSGKRLLYFRFKIDLGSNAHPQYEYVPGYVEIQTYGTYDNNGQTLGYIKLKDLEINKVKGILHGNRKETSETYDNQFKKANPISKIAWQFTRLNTPWIAFPGSDYLTSSLDPDNKKSNVLFSFIPEVLKNVVGFQRAMLIDGKSRRVHTDLSLSVIRLKNPNGHKYGGGSRVKSIKIADNWASMATTETSHTYGQVYDYTTTENGQIISSGVASWEPMLGGDENPHRMPIMRKEKNTWAPDNNLYNSLPIGEELFPSASVGYSKVTTRNLTPQDIDPNLTKTTNYHSTGVLVQEFFTAKDYPTLTRQTTIKRNKIDKVPTNFLIGSQFDEAKATQGFVVELNDMHGKPKASESINNNGLSINRTEYIYQSADVNNPQDDNQKIKQLRNKVNVLNMDGTVSEAKIGYEMEVIVDPRHSVDNSQKVHIGPNVDAILPAAFFPTLKVWGGVQRTSVKTASVTKIIQRNGLISKIKVTQDGATLETQNLAYNAETGQVMLSRTQDEFNNYQYSLSIPAHWGYDQMGGAYQNIGAVVKDVSSVGGIVNITSDIFVPGDELLVSDDNGDYLSDRYWVLDVHKLSGTLFKVSIIDRNGDPIIDGTKSSIEIIRSGRRNLQSAQMGSIVLQENPIQGSVGSQTWDTYNSSNSGPLSDKVLVASALEYIQHRQQYPNEPIGDIPNYCENVDEECEPTESLNSYPALDIAKYFFIGKKVNPYVAGILGNWSAGRSFAFNNKVNPERSVSPNVAANNNNFNHTDISTDGAYKDFDFFWKYNPESNFWDHGTYNSITATWEPGSTDNDDINNKWTWVEQATITDPNGNGLETKNALDIYSCAQYGYDRLLPVAVAANSTTNQMVYDGFEDYHGLETIYACAGGYVQNSLLFESTLNQTHHWPIWKNFIPTVSQVSSEESHSGKYSLKMLDRDVTVTMSELTGSASNSGTPMTEYKITGEDLVNGFLPQGGDYQLSFWYKLTPGAMKPWIEGTYKDPGQMDITVSDQEHKSAINGWHRYSCKISIPQGVLPNEVSLVIKRPDLDPLVCVQPAIYLDDFRMHPYQGSMKSFVYDQLNNRLMATLDDNNYATFYEYDEQGNLIRTKVETERGVFTIQENSSSTVQTPH